MILVDVKIKDCYDCYRMESKKLKWYQKIWRRSIKDLRWLEPGLGVKRWIGLILIGTTLIGLGFAVLILDIYRNAADTWWIPVLATLSLRFLNRGLRALVFGGSGIAFILIGVWGLNRALLKPFVRSGKQVIEAVTAYRRRERGPRVVVIGGGTGLASLLRGIKLHTTNLTAIVTVADDGGSSGELRKNMGVLPPGDIRNCLTAMSSDEALLTQVFQYRFSEGAGLNGHTLGNLLITALADITGSFEEAVAESGRVLAVEGQVLPSTLQDVRLEADIYLPDEVRNVRVSGESRIPQAAGKIRRVWLTPNHPQAYPPAIQAILSADLILVGPGSLYTSILPNLLVPDIGEAIRVSRAIKFYICNVATQSGETDGYSCGDHIRTIGNHMGSDLFDLVVCNNHFIDDLSNKVHWVKPEGNLEESYAVYMADLIDKDKPWRHDSKQLAQVVMDLYYERTGPLLGREDEKPK